MNNRGGLRVNDRRGLKLGGVTLDTPFLIRPLPCAGAKTN